jgi:hypothetical protein
MQSGHKCEIRNRRRAYLDQAKWRVVGHQMTAAFGAVLTLTQSSGDPQISISAAPQKHLPVKLTTNSRSYMVRRADHCTVGPVSVPGAEGSFQQLTVLDCGDQSCVFDDIGQAALSPSSHVCVGSSDRMTRTARR